MTLAATLPQPASDDLRLQGGNSVLAETLATQLHELLETEFSQLKAGELDGLEALQSRKMLLLEQLAQVAPGPLPPARDVPLAWQTYAETARACRLLHQRNEALVTRQLDAVRGALTALQSSGEGLIEETYDRSGRLRWGTPARRAPRAWRDV